MSPGTEIERRVQPRGVASSSVNLIWKNESGQRLIETGHAIDLSAGGIAIQTAQPFAAASCLILRAPTMGIVALSQLRHCSWNRSAYRVGLRFLLRADLPSPELAETEPDPCEFLRQAATHDSTQAAHIHQLYRSLSFRYHPDNRDTGDAEMFLCIGEIYRIVSCPRIGGPEEERTPARGFQSSFPSAHGEKARRLGVLGLLYQRRMSDCTDASLSCREICQITGVTASELDFVLWYLREKGLVTSNDSAAYCITAPGADVFEDALTPTHA